MWRLVYVPRKLSSADKCKLSKACGSNLSDLNLMDTLGEVCVRDLNCYDPVKKLY